MLSLARSSGKSRHTAMELLVYDRCRTICDDFVLVLRTPPPDRSATWVLGVEHVGMVWNVSISRTAFLATYGEQAVDLLTGIFQGNWPDTTNKSGEETTGLSSPL